MRFTATTEEGDSLTMDTDPVSGGEGHGFRPVKLVLVGLGGCTGMDIIWILKRQRQEVTGLEVKVTGTRRKKDPMYYEAVEVEYVVRGRNLRESAVKRAIELSEQKYCSVRGIFRPDVKVTTSYRIEQEA
ncbi:MAG: OsmC family protein [Candidatus Bathyarchaeia archaeon]|jgi:putative redox protein